MPFFVCDRSRPCLWLGGSLVESRGCARILCWALPVVESYSRDAVEGCVSVCSVGCFPVAVVKEVLGCTFRDAVVVCSCVVCKSVMLQM